MTGSRDDAVADPVPTAGRAHPDEPAGAGSTRASERTRHDEGSPRRRDAAGTRRLLLEAAHRRFAAAGYRSTTVRDISDEAGVNVALIARYFGSKEGLFEACLTGVADDLGNTVPTHTTLDEVPALLAARLGESRGAPASTQLVLLLRTSGDDRAEEIRRGILQTFAERLAGVAGWTPGGAGGDGTGPRGSGGVRSPQEEVEADRILLRAQIVLSAAFGLSLLRATTRLEPLASAGPDELVGPFRDLVTALLARG